MGQTNFFSCLKYCDGIVGNSDCSGSTDGGSGGPGCGDFYVYDYESGFSGGTNFANNYTSPNPRKMVKCFGLATKMKP